jgi:osmotically-inducible protein OsmY
MMKSNRRHAASVLATLLVIAVGTFGMTAVAGGKSDETSELDEMMLHSKVRLALLDNIGSDALGIDIDVHGTEVTLSGELSKRKHKELAAKYVKHVEGVKNVDNDLRWNQQKGESSMAKSAEELKREVQDSALATRVKLALLSEIGTDAFDLDVEAASNKVTLSGKVQNDSERKLAVSAAEKVDGVEEVTSLLSTEMARQY